MKNIIVIAFIGIFLFGFKGTKDNYSVLMELKNSAMSVIEEHQYLINTNRDGTKSDKGIDKNYIGKQVYAAYASATKNSEWSIPKLRGSKDKKQLSTALTIFLAHARIVIAKLQPMINIDSDGTQNPKKFYPAVFGRLTADEFLERTGIKLKQTTLGKGHGARNKKYNKPDDWETKVLKKFIKNPKTKGFGEKITSGYRFMYPLRIKKACLSCHGEPAGQKDISGHIKEGYKLGEIRGGISVVIK
jgi:hypothetical protein